MTQKRTIHKKELAQRIKNLCQEKGLSVNSVESDAGYSTGMISRWCSAGDEEDFNVLSKLVTMADILEVSVDDLLGLSKTREVLVQEENTDIFFSLIKATMDNRLTWNELESEKRQQLFGNQLTDSERGRMISKTWYTMQGDVFFALVSYCDDLADFNELLELEVYVLVGHGIAPFSLQTSNAEMLQTLYGYIQCRAALQSLSSIKPDQNRTNNLRVVEVSKTNSSRDNTIDFGDFNMAN